MGPDSLGNRRHFLAILVSDTAKLCERLVGIGRSPRTRKVEQEGGGDGGDWYVDLSAETRGSRFKPLGVATRDVSAPSEVAGTVSELTEIAQVVDRHRVHVIDG